MGMFIPNHLVHQFSVDGNNKEKKRKEKRTTNETGSFGLDGGVGVDDERLSVVGTSETKTKGWDELLLQRVLDVGQLEKRFGDVERRV